MLVPSNALAIMSASGLRAIGRRITVHTTKMPTGTMIPAASDGRNTAIVVPQAIVHSNVIGLGARPKRSAPNNAAMMKGADPVVDQGQTHTAIAAREDSVAMR